MTDISNNNSNKSQLNSFVLIMTIIGHHTCPVRLFVFVEVYATFESETNGLNYVPYN